MLWFIIYEQAEISKKACTDACNCFFNQIDEDLKIWRDGISQDDFERASGIINTVHYQIIDGHIYRSDWFSNILPSWSTLASSIQKTNVQFENHYENSTKKNVYSANDARESKNFWSTLQIQFQMSSLLSMSMIIQYFIEILVSSGIYSLIWLNRTDEILLILN